MASRISLEARPPLPRQSPPMKIAIVGAGLAGLCAARSLMDAGERDLTVFEPHAGPGLETSHANGALLHPSSVEPWNSPGILRQVLANLGREDSAMLLRPRALPSLLGWGWRFVRESAPARHRAHTLANVALALRSVRLMRGPRDEGLDYGAAACGSLAIFRDAAAFAAGREHARWLRGHGVPSRELSPGETVAREPALEPLAPVLAGAIFNEGDEGGDAYRFCLALAAQLEARGVRFFWGTRVEALQMQGGRLGGVRVREVGGERVDNAHNAAASNGARTEPFDAVVLAAAWWSVALAAPLGLALPVRPAKGYSLTLPLPADASGGMSPRTPVIDNDLHVAVVPVAGARLRVAGTAEFAGESRAIEPARIDNLRRQLLRVYPTLATHVASAPRQEWTGLRPMCADGKPLIGRTRVPGLFLNTGHGQLGWTTAAGSGELLAAAVTGAAPAVDPAPFAPARFGL
jgi:D-amino-acid dehydrogenase